MKNLPNLQISSPRPATENIGMVIVCNNSGCIGAANALFEGPSPSSSEDEDTGRMTIIVMI
jgi:hypothetical protein